MRQYGEVLITSARDVPRRWYGNFLCVTCGTIWGCSQDFILGRPQDDIFKDVGRRRPQDLEWGRSLALYRGPHGDVFRGRRQDVHGT